MLKSNKIFFLREFKPSQSIEPIDKISQRKFSSEQVLFLRNFVKEIGKSSLRRRQPILIKKPIQEKVVDKDIEFVKVLPKFKPKPVKRFEKKLPVLMNKKVEIKKLPVLEKKSLPIVEEKKKLPELSTKISEERIYSENNITYYKPIKNIKSKQYGIITPLMADKEIKRISFDGTDIKVDYKNYKGIDIDLKFKNSKFVNKLIKNFAKEAGIEVSEENPILDIKIFGFKIHANYGTKYVSPNFVLIRE